MDQVRIIGTHIPELRSDIRSGMKEFSSGADLVDHASGVFGFSKLERAIVDVLLDATGVIRRNSMTVGELAAEAKLEPSQVTAALSPSARLLGFGLITLEGSGPILCRTIALDDEFWPRLVGAPIVGVMRPRAVETRKLAELALSARNADVARAAMSWFNERHGRWPALVVQGAISSGR